MTHERNILTLSSLNEYVPCLSPMCTLCERVNRSLVCVSFIIHKFFLFCLESQDIFGVGLNTFLIKSVLDLFCFIFPKKKLRT